MKHLKSTLIFYFLLLTGSIFVLQAQGLEYEIDMGPQMTKAVVTDFAVGIIDNNKPLTNKFPLGYALNLVVRNKSEHLQVGLQLMHDYTKFNVYLPVQWPSDYNSKKTSRWDNYYQAFRFGLGGQLRYSLDKIFVQTNLSYVSTLSTTSKSSFYHASDDSIEDTEGKDYSKAGGLLGGVSIGTQFNKKDHHSFNISVNIQYSFYHQRYLYETFLHDWTVRPINFALMFGYQFSKTDK